MKKALIFTLYGNVNYGNKLQNIAVQELLKKYDIESKTVVSNQQNKSFIDRIKIAIKYMIPSYRHKLQSSNLRKRKFELFDEKINKIDYKKIDYRDYDYIIVGSDQVWNPNDFLSQQLVERVNRINDKIIISISGSIAVNGVDEQYIEKYKRHFNKINNLSVREEQGMKLIKAITGRDDICVLLDPTMLVDKTMWEKLLSKPNQFDNRKIKSNKYILNYFLGELSQDRKNEIERIAEENDCIIIDLMDINSDYYINAPGEFLYLEKNAFLICTDSFHSAVFGLLFDKPFIIFNRQQSEVKNMSSRLDNFIEKFKLKNRKFNGEEITKENLQHDYTEAYKILEKERNKSELFLKKALNIKGSD